MTHDICYVLCTFIWMQWVRNGRVFILYWQIWLKKTLKKLIKHYLCLLGCSKCCISPINGNRAATLSIWRWTCFVTNILWCPIIQDFLLLEEMQSVYCGNNKATINHEQDQKLGVTIKNGSAKWTSNSIVDTLTHINLWVKPGKLCAVIGPVGSGKVSMRLVFLRSLG
jgi:ABC-type multidrug transport system fused ATPase/permease subunit